MKLRKRLLASLLTLTLVVPLFSAAATLGTVQAEETTPAEETTSAEAPAPIIQTEKNEMNQICDASPNTYAVLSGKVKMNAKNFSTEGHFKNVQFWVTPVGTEGTEGYTAFSQFQVMCNNDASDWRIKVIYSDNKKNEDGVKVSELSPEKEGEPLLANIKEEGGLNFKIVRLDAWAYFLVKDTDGGYKLVGKMSGLKDKPTQFTISNDEIENGDSVELSNYAVTTGKENALAALAGSKFTVEDTTEGKNVANVADSVYFPVESTQWTVQARVSLPGYSQYIASQDEHRSMHVGPGAGKFNGYAWDYGMGIDYWGSWVVQRLENQISEAWNGNKIETAHAEKLNPEKKGMWVRWVRSDNKLSVHTSADGITWTYVHGRTDLGEMDLSANGIYIDADEKTDLTDFEITLNGNITQKKGQKNVLCAETTEKYAVLSGNVKMDATEFTGSDSKAIFKSVQFYVADCGDIDFSRFQVLNLGNADDWEIKVHNSNNANNGKANGDGVEVVGEQSKSESILANVKNEAGLDFKIVRLDDWAYFLVEDTEGGYKLVGQMYGLKDKNTKFAMSNDNLDDKDTVELSNYSVTTGKENALAALAGSKFSVNGGDAPQYTKDAFYFPLDSKEWTFEAKVKTSTTLGTAVYVGPGPKGDDRKDESGYYGVSTGWKYGLGVVYNDNWVIKEPGNGDDAGKPIPEDAVANISSGGLYVRWVRWGTELSTYVSTDRNKWTLINSRTDLGVMHNITGGTDDNVTETATGLFVNGLATTELSDIKITLKGNITQAQGVKNVLCAETEEKYAVLSGNVKLNYTENTFNDWANVEFNVTPTSRIQILWYVGREIWEFKVPIDPLEQRTDDGVTVKRDQTDGATLLANITKDTGLDFKFVRLGDWAYFLVKDTSDKRYKLVGKMGGLNGQNTYFLMKNGCLQSGDTVELSNYTVTTGKEEALAALAGSKFSVNGGDAPQCTKDAFYFPLDSKEWTFEAKVKTNTASGTAVYVGPGPKGDRKDEYGYYGVSTGWKYGLGVVKDSEWVIKEPGNVTDAGKSIQNYEEKLTSGDLYVRWVRSETELSTYVSEDRNEWTLVKDRKDVGTIKNISDTSDEVDVTETATGLFVNGMEADLSDIKISLAKGEMKGSRVSLGDMITMKFYMTFPKETLDDGGAKIQYTLPGINGTTNSYLIKNLSTEEVGTSEKVSCKMFPLDVAAKEMASDIKFRVVSGDGSYGKEFKYKVKDNAQHIIDDKGYTNEAKDLAKAMLNYGASAQTYFNFNIGNLANDGMAAPDIIIGTPEFTDATYQKTKKMPAGLTYYGTSLITTSPMAIRHYFTLEPGANINSYTFTCDGKTLVPQLKKDNMYYVDIEKITAIQLREMFDLKISYSSSSEYYLKYGPYTYVQNTMKKNNPNLANLAKAIYYYGEAAYAYKTSANSPGSSGSN